METTLLGPSAQLAHAILRRQRISMWILVAAIIAVVVGIALLVVAVVEAWRIKDDLDDTADSLAAKFALLNITALASSASAMQAASLGLLLPFPRASPASLPSQWLVLGDPFAGGYPATGKAVWHSVLAAALGGGSSAPHVTVSTSSPQNATTATLSQLLAQALSKDSSLQAAVSASRPLLVFVSHGYEKLLTRASTVDGLYGEYADAFSAYASVFASPQTRVVVLRRPLPALGEASYVPQDREDCTQVPGGAVFNLPSSPEQSHSLPLAASSLAASVPLLALLSHPASALASTALSDSLLERYGLLSPGAPALTQCLYATPDAQQILAQYLANALSGAPYLPPASISVASRR
jgi:hypothetical protein